MKKLYLERANVGNQMFRMMFAEYLRRRIPNAVITGASIPEWGILLNDDPPSRGTKVVPPGHNVDIPRLVETIVQPDCDGAILGNFAMRLEYFEANRDMFVAMFQTSAGGQATYPDELVIHVRAGDILGGIHGDYNLVPISHYRRLVESTGLKPVFTGQTKPSFYSDALRKAFPNARFLAGNHWLDDFQTTRNAHNIAISVSSFVWLAAWLSQTATRIYMPLLGLFNPEQRPDVDLIPRNDSRYIFTQFPVEKFNGSPEQIARVLADSGPTHNAWAGSGVQVKASWMSPA